MSLIEKKFYNIFWQNKSCQNLFLLSKEELLDATTIGSNENTYTYTSNKIIVSNVEENENDILTIRLRNESDGFVLDETMESKVEYFKPIIGDFLNKRFEKPFAKLMEDVEENGWGLFWKVIDVVIDEEYREEKIIKLLQNYGFIGKHLNSFNELEKYIEGHLIFKKRDDLINEHNINTFLEGINIMKDFYINYSYQRLYSSNQILVNSLSSSDNFDSRLKLFHLLYESKIILPSDEDAFVECSNCEPGNYKATLQLKINPKKLKNLICPICSCELTYFVPYSLDDEIYMIIKEKDGLLLNALCNKLKNKDFTYSTNQIYLDDIEIDCVFKGKERGREVTCIVETKMYKLNTSKRKLKNKVKKSFGKLFKDVNRILTLEEYQSKEVFSILLVNINDTNLLDEIGQDLQVTNTKNNNSYILNIETLESVLNI